MMALCVSPETSTFLREHTVRLWWRRRTNYIGKTLVTGHLLSMVILCVALIPDRPRRYD